jgi:phytoene synthase
MMSLIMGTRQQIPLTRACELGLAMQLTNIARDVGEDAKNDRLYLPLDWMREEGIDPESWLKDPQFTPQIARVVDRLLKTADMLYQRSQNGISQLPRDCRAAIYGARLVYAQIGRQIEKQDLDSVSQRAIVSSAKKKLLMLKALSATIHVGQVKTDLKPIAAIQYLVEAVPYEDPYAHYAGSFEQRMVWVINTLEKAERHRLARM